MIERGQIPADVVFSHGLAHGRARLFRAEPRRRLHHGGGGQGARRGAGSEPQRAVRLRQLPRPYLAGDRAGRKRRAGTGSRPAQDRPGAGGDRQVRRRPDRRRRDAADRLRRHSRRGGDATHPQARPRRPHRNDRRRHPDADRERRGHQPAQELQPRARSVATFALGSNKLYRFMDRNPMLEMHPVDCHQRSRARRPERQPGRHQRHHAGRPGRPVRLREPGRRRPTPAPAARPTSCAPPIARATASPSSCCRRRPRTTRFRASCRR